MNRRKKTLYGCILLGGAVLLLADRLFFGASSHVAEAAAGSRSLSALGVDTPAGPAVSVVMAPFPRDLPPLPPRGALRDVFQMADRARDLLVAPGSGDTDGARDARGGITPDQFSGNHKLSGVMRDGDKWVAVVDSTWLIVGQSIDGCELVEISGDGAVFKCPGGRATLSVLAEGRAP